MADAYDSTKDSWGGGASANAPDSPARIAIAVTPSDTKDVTNGAGDNAAVYAKSLYIGVTGDVAIVAAGDKTVAGTSIVYKAHPVGYLPTQVRRVMSTGTTATNIVGLYDR
jgi:hypothetical protein